MERITVPDLSRYSKVKTKAATEYQDLVNEAAKLTGQKYIIMHKRFERAFAGMEVDYVLAKVRTWLHEAKKDNKPAIKFNYRFKLWREAQKQNAV